MATKTTDGSSNYTNRVGCRLTQFEHQRLKAEAESHGLTLSQLVRARVTGTRLISRIEVKAINELRLQGAMIKAMLNESKMTEGKLDEDRLQAVLDQMREQIVRMST